MLNPLVSLAPGRRKVPTVGATRLRETKVSICLIEAAQQSNSITPNPNAYNNICTSYNQLKQYDKAIEACTEALKLDADHQLAKGNIEYAKSQINY